MAKLDFDIDKYLDKKLIESMNSQMQPSDEVVSDLLTKISDLEKAGLKTVDMPEVKAKPKKGLSAVPKRVWYYSSAVAASVVILFATFTAIGGGGIDKIKDAFEGIVNINIVTDDQSKDDESIIKSEQKTPDSKEEKVSVVTDTDSEKNTSEQEEKDKEKPGKEEKNSKPESKDDKNSAKEQTVKNEKDEEGIDIDNSEDKSGNEEGNALLLQNEQSDENSQSDGNQPVNPDDSDTGEEGKLTDPVISEGEKPQSETQQEKKYEPVEMMTIEGNNYIVGSTAKTATLSEESSVSLEVPTNSGAPKKMTVKALKSVSPKLMMAVMPEEGHEEEPVMLYTNSDYVPENFGRFTEDADIVSVSDYGLSGAEGLVKRGKNVAGWKWTNFKAGEQLKTSFKENILSQTDAKYVESFPSSGNVKVIFESTSNSTGIILYFTVTSTGYLNIALEDEAHNPLNEFTFFIGKEQTRKFIFDVTGE